MGRGKSYGGGADDEEMTEITDGSRSKGAHSSATGNSSGTRDSSGAGGLSSLSSKARAAARLAEELEQQREEELRPLGTRKLVDMVTSIQQKK